MTKPLPDQKNLTYGKLLALISYYTSVGNDEQVERFSKQLEKLMEKENEKLKSENNKLH